MSDKPRKGQDEVFSITSAAESHSDELGSREKRYAISMGIRTACVVAALIIPILWLRLLLILLGMVLPYTSVVIANAGVRKKGDGPSPFAKETRPELEHREPTAGTPGE